MKKIYLLSVFIPLLSICYCQQVHIKKTVFYKLYQGANDTPHSYWFISEKVNWLTDSIVQIMRHMDSTYYVEKDKLDTDNYDIATRNILLQRDADSIPEGADENYHLISDRTYIIKDNSYTVYALNHDTHACDDDGIIYFSPEFGILLDYATSWSNLLYTEDIYNINQKVRLILNELANTVLQDTTFFPNPYPPIDFSMIEANYKSYINPLLETCLKHNSIEHLINGDNISTVYISSLTNRVRLMDIEEFDFKLYNKPVLRYHGDSYNAIQADIYDIHSFKDGQEVYIDIKNHRYCFICKEVQDNKWSVLSVTKKILTDDMLM